MDQQRVGRFISQLRHERGMTQEELGERLGVTNKTVSRWETGKYMPDIDKLLELSSTLGVTVNELLTGECLETPERAVRAAEENIVAMLSESETFGLADRVEFFKHKWLREHRFDIAVAVALFICAVIALWIWVRSLFPAAGLLGIVIYGFMRNRMMAYVELRAFKK